MKKSKNEPNIEALLDEKEKEIFATFYCMLPGKINSFDKTTQSAKVEIQIKARKNETEIVSYPILVDVPVFFLQGAKAFIEMPIEAGDQCMVLFCDRDISDWWVTGNVKEPPSLRKHNLSDGIAIVGINTKIKPLSLDGQKIKIDLSQTSYPLEIKTASGKIKIDSSGNITFNDGTEPFVLGTQLETQLTTILTALQTFTTGLNITTLSGQATTCATAMGTALGLLNQLKSTQIKGK